MLNNEFWPVWVVSAGVVVPLVAVVVVCICGCRKTVPKNELLGLAGVVKITNPEERLNHNHEPIENATAVVSAHNNTRDSNDISRRTTTANRSLPDIPIDPNQHRPGIRETLWEPEANGDTSSELYATVEENKQQSQPLVAIDITSMQGLEPSPDRESDQTDSFSTYARVPIDHPYDKLKSSEHPYAKVGGTSHILDSVNPEGSEVRENLRNGNVQNVIRDPVPPPRRSRRGASQSSLVSNGTLASMDIAAASAITGGVHASQDLPYMTPPINFSGDSQDNKGYTSISVREPLETIKAETRAAAASQRNRTHEPTFPDYASVSDDSAKKPHVTHKKITFYGTQLYMLNQNYAYEMYANIDDAGPVYTSGSETYAQIQSTVTDIVPIQELPVISLENSSDSGSTYPPQPPSVDSLKHVAQAHSRQASSSSATSSVVNLGSPKPEKRQANSPLPPPPPIGSPDLRLTLPHANLEEMYAKVVKKRRRAVSMPEAESMPVISQPVDVVSRLSVEADVCQDSVPQVEIDSDSVCSISLDVATVPLSSEGRSESDSTFTSVNEKGLPEEEYESRPNRVESFKSSEPGYESVFLTNVHLAYDPGYEQVNQLERNPSDCDPNYEPLRHHLKETVESEESANKIRDERTVVRETLFNTDNEFVPNYAQSNSTNSQGVDEPNYESMTSESQEPNYAVVSGSVGDESDSNYEVVVQDDPNYESVNYFDVNSTDPPYERLHNEEAKDSDNDTISGYEKVKLQNSTASNDFGNRQVSDNRNSRSDPGYEEVGQSLQSVTDASLSSARAEDLYSKVIKANTRM